MEFNDLQHSFKISSFNEITDKEVGVFVKKIFPDLQIQKLELKKGRGNSKVFKLISFNEKRYILKIYPNRQFDHRPRLETEFFACTILKQAGFPVMEAIAKNEDMNLGIYSWIDGTLIESPDGDFIENSTDFIKRIKILHRVSEKFRSLPSASEACFSGSEIVRQVHERLYKLNQVDSEELNNFLNKKFLQKFEFLMKMAKNSLGDIFEIPLDNSLHIPSPSDFGSHNAIKSKSGEVIFIDFEYFGFDDPVKLVCDFYWHPAMDLSEKLKIQWIQETSGIFKDDPSFEKRLVAYLPLFGLKWCLILLNEFLPDRLAQRIHADPTKICNIKSLQAMQFRKSQNILNKIIKTDLFCGSAL